MDVGYKSEEELAKESFQKKLRNRHEDLVVFAFAMGELKEEGLLDNLSLMECYEKATHIWECWCTDIKDNFDWETHYILGGEDWDMQIRSYTEKYLDIKRPIVEKR